MRVELDLFSGRPNPSWELSEREASELGKLLERVTLRTECELPGLGYRGFVLHGDPPRRVYQLPAVEHWLLTSAEPHLGAELTEIVRRALQGGG